MNRYIDTHIHLVDFTTKYILDNIAICPAIIEDDWEKIVQLYQKNPNLIVPAFGLHPWYINKASNNWQQHLETLLQTYPNACVGETGLDRHKNPEAEPQNKIFKIHIELAKKYHRPLLIHAVKCTEWLDDYWPILPPRFVFHSYNARRELLKKIINTGGYVSFSASIIANREKDKILRAVPINRMLLETDGPYQKGNIAETALEIAKIINMDINDFAKQIYKNSQDFING